MKVHVKWQFECAAKLPVDPVGRGHKQEIELAVVRGQDPRLDEVVQRGLGRRGKQCLALNMADAVFGRGHHEIVCGYCGVPAFRLWVFPSSQAGTYTVLYRQVEKSSDVGVVTVEVVDAEPDED